MRYLIVCLAIVSLFSCRPRNQNSAVDAGVLKEDGTFYLFFSPADPAKLCMSTCKGKVDPVDLDNDDARSKACSVSGKVVNSDVLKGNPFLTEVPGEFISFDIENLQGDDRAEAGHRMIQAFKDQGKDSYECNPSLFLLNQRGQPDKSWINCTVAYDGKWGDSCFMADNPDKAMKACRDYAEAPANYKNCRPIPCFRYTARLSKTLNKLANWRTCTDYFHRPDGSKVNALGEHLGWFDQKKR